jgi:uncharacterized protein
MEWIWNPHKAASNLVDHDVYFEIAVIALEDPFQLSVPDPHEDDNRWRTICMVNAAILFVVHTIPNDDGVGRIISARNATKTERRRYEQARH